MKKTLREISIPKDDSPLMQDMGGEITNGDIFLATRQFQDEGIKSGVAISNLSQIYFWAIEKRDILKAG